MISCLGTQHEPWLVALALLVGIAGSWTTFRLFSQAQTRSGWQRTGWIVLTAQAAGSSIWCMHFIGVIAYETDVPFTFDPMLTMVSLLVAVAGCAYGFRLALASGIPFGPEIGGAVVGAAISTMHYSGMLAFRVEGWIEWDFNYVALSVAFAMVFGTLSLRQAVKPKRATSGLRAVALFVAAVVSLHFTGIAAMSIIPAPLATEPSTPSALAAFAVVGVSMLVISAGLISYLIDERMTQDTFHRLQQLALHDSLTGLPNRVSALEHIDREFTEASAAGSKVAVIGIDLDRFKEINDVHGHKVGDDVLVRIGQRLGGLVRPGEFVARIGGDEFMAVTRFTSRDQLNGFLARLDAALTAPLGVGAIDLVSSASLGVALYPDDGGDRETLICHADLAMYQAKFAIGRNIFFYEPEMEQAVRAHHTLARDLGRALELDQFVLHYQVQTCVETGDVIGYEALLRWNHPVRGNISPAVFIPVAEETGHILAIGEWVLRAACREAVCWDQPFKIAVNLSPVQFIHADIPGLVHSVLLETGLSPQRLELEITESTFITDKVRVLHVLRQVKALGVMLAIDDFGIGYSCFDTLRSFPFDKLKLAGSFTRDAERSPVAQAIERSVLALGRSLSIPVLAEGVETAEQLRFLRSEGCVEAQGYYLGRPGPIVRGMPAAETVMPEEMRVACYAS